MDETITLAEAATRAGISIRTARRWIHAGQLPAQLQKGRYGLEYRVPVAAVAARQGERNRSLIARESEAALQQVVAQTWQEIARMQHDLAQMRAEMQQVDSDLLALRQALDAARDSPTAISEPRD